MSDIGEPTNYLGLEIDKKAKVLKLSQQTYIDKILKQFGYENSHPQRTPMVTNKVSNRERIGRKIENENSIFARSENQNNRMYREVVGSLLYLANASRPDVAYGVNVLSRHQIDRKEEDWKMVERMLRYLKGTKVHSLNYYGDSNDMPGYSDASFGDCKGAKTTGGYVIKLFIDTITWRTKKQNYVAQSTCQAEYVAMSDCGPEMISIHNCLKRVLDWDFTPIILWCDNKAAEASAKTNGGSKLRHVTEVKEHYVRECVQRKLVKVKWIASNRHNANVLTKPLSFDLYLNLINRIMNF